MKTEKDFKNSQLFGEWLRKNPIALEARKQQVKAQNAGVEPIVSKSSGTICKCKTCGSKKEHPETGYCFECDTDNW